MSRVTLDDIRTATDAKYGPFVMETELGDITLLSALRLSKDLRIRLVRTQKEMAEAREAKDAELLEELLRQMFEILAPEGGDDVETLYAAVDGDTVLLSEVLNAYGRASQLPQANSSAT